MALDLITAGCPALDTMEEDNGGLELTLGLSIGGSSHKSPTAGGSLQEQGTDARSGKTATDFGGPGSSPSSSPPPPPSPQFLLQIDGEDALEPLRRREIHAFRRREARKKRDQKQQRKGTSRARSGAVTAAAAQGSNGVLPPLERACSSDDRLAMEEQERRMRVKDREAKVEEALDCVPNHKLCPNTNPNANSQPSFNPDHSNPNLVIAMQYPYPHLPYVPITNGFGIPCIMPCWGPAMSPAAEGPKPERNVFHPVPSRAFQRFLPPLVELSNGGSPLSSDAVDSNDGKAAGKRALSWVASQGSSSSPASSDQQSRSLQGGSSSSHSDARSRSGHGRSKSQPQPPPPASSLTTAEPNNRIPSSRRVEPDLNAVEEEQAPGTRSTSCPNRTPSAGKGELAVVSAADDTGGSPQDPSPALPRMPCVSTTGKGPNGRTITGVLYRYTKTDVSIVCACHGSSFSPAEFVKHAGGVDVSHPLRQITVVSS